MTNTTWRFEDAFAALNAAATEDELKAIRDRAEVERIRAQLANDSQTATLAADIASRATAKLPGERAHKHGRRRTGWIPLHSFVRDRR